MITSDTLNFLHTPSGRGESYVRDISAGWNFGGVNIINNEYAEEHFKSNRWQVVDVPHTWNTSGTEDCDSRYRRTIYWYRKTIEWDTSFENKRIYIEFQGVNQKTDLFVNGENIPYNGGDKYTHKGGYTAFRYDITKQLNKDENIILVRVDNRIDEEIAPIMADFNMCGGIYRRVSMIVVDNVHIDLNNNGSSGLFLTTPGVRSLQKPQNFGALNIKADIVNDSDEEKTVTVIAVITGENAPGPIIEQLVIDANSRAIFCKDTKIENPHLWNGITYENGDSDNDVGYMYNVTLTVFDGEKELDRVTDNVGFRYFFADKQRGFFLNGRPYRLNGVNRHQFWEGKGNALLESDHDADIEIIKEMGVNAIRLCHYPHTEYFYDLCDKNGIVLWTEIPLVNELGTSEGFADVTKSQLVELIRQQYNRPSVMFWGIHNELGSANGDLRNPYIKGKQIVAQLDCLAHTEDISGRYTVQAANVFKSLDGGNPENIYDNTVDLGWSSDIVGCNIYPNWYVNGDYEGSFEDTTLRYAGKDSRPMAITEYGWGANINQHELYPVLGENDLLPAGSWHPEEYQCLAHEEAIDYINRQHYLWGVFAWVMFDFTVSRRFEGGQLALNDKGLVTADRKTKKDSFYLYKANWNKKDIFTYITSRRYEKRKEQKTYIKVYSNCDTVELFVNGESVGYMMNVGNGVFETGNIQLEKGKNNIKVVGKIFGGDNEYIDNCVWTV